MVSSINPYGMYPQYYSQMNHPQYNTNFNANRTMPINKAQIPQGITLLPQSANKDFYRKLLELQKHLPTGEVKSLCPNQSETRRNNTIKNEKNHIARPITERTAYNTKQLRSIGIPEREIKKYLRLDGHVNDEGKKLLKKHGKSYK